MSNIIFDLYGTLIDIHTDEENDLFWTRFTQETNKYYQYTTKELRDKYLSLCGKYSKTIDEIELLNVFAELFHQSEAVTKEIAICFRELSTEYIRLYSGVKKLLKMLKNDGHKLYVLSNAQRCFTYPELEKLGLIPFFDAILISSDYGVKKPSSNFYNALLYKYNLDRSDSIMIGNDYECDYMAAKSVGLKAIYIHSNLTPKEQPREGLKGFKAMNVYNEIKSLL